MPDQIDDGIRREVHKWEVRFRHFYCWSFFLEIARQVIEM